MRSLLRQPTAIAAGALAIALGAQLSLTLPHTPVPQTAQTLAVLLVAAALGPFRGTTAVGLYILMGAMGLPVFASGGAGLHRIVGPTAGYLLGFLLAALLIGKLSADGRMKSLRLSVAAMLLAHATILVAGSLWLARTLGPSEAFAKGIRPFLLAAVVKSVVAALAAYHLARYPERRERT